MTVDVLPGGRAGGPESVAVGDDDDGCRVNSGGGFDASAHFGPDTGEINEHVIPSELRRRFRPHPFLGSSHLAGNVCGCCRRAARQCRRDTAIRPETAVRPC